MTYIRIRNWERYQNADVFKKSNGRPPWCKLFTRRDLLLDEASLEARLLFYELLKVASEYANVMRSDPEWIARETRLPSKAVAKGLPELLKGAWLSETKSPRRSRKTLDGVATREEVDEDKELGSASAGKGTCAECDMGGGRHTSDCSRRLRVA